MAGVRGLYVPAMLVEHFVPAARMRLAYHRRWWYWKGVARARLQVLYPVSELGIDQAAVPQFLRMPRFMWRTAITDAAGWLFALVRLDAARRIERELMLVYFAGYLMERLRTKPAPVRPRPAGPVSRHGRADALPAPPDRVSALDPAPTTAGSDSVSSNAAGV